MGSSLAWLDFSEAEQRRAREIVQLFSQRESRDELGIGIVRDAFSNSMFPGVSVIHTRARYFCIVPWLFLKAGERGRTGQQFLRWQISKERALVEILRAGGDEEGLIGRQAGRAVKTLPSVIYWSSLQRYGILRATATIEQVESVQRRQVSIDDAITELVDRSGQLWDPYLPPAPEGFPDLERLDFTLTDEESAWLRERIISSTPGSLLGWMVGQGHVPQPVTSGPWDEPWVSELPPEIGRTVHHAELFSLVMHGAAILYNALLAERCVELGIGDRAGEAADYRQWFDTWREHIDERGSDVASWNLDDFWALVLDQHPGRVTLSKRFIDQWIALVRAGQETTSAADALIVAREREQKHAQARLDNERLLRQWGGASGSDPLTFRWGQVRRMTSDLDGGAD